ncbi:hypothetical protein NMS00_004114 [Vibrio alginolyticus]|nr:hypothetical protein [Vibrio alginolyticus]
MYEFISGLSNSINTIDRLRSINKNIENSEFNNLLADLSTELSKTKLELADLMEQFTELKKENALLKKQAKQKEEVTFLDNFVFQNDSEGIPFGPAYCRSCFNNFSNFYPFKRLQGTNMSSCVGCSFEAHFMDAGIIMTPDLFEELKQQFPKRFS